MVFGVLYSALFLLYPIVSSLILTFVRTSIPILTLTLTLTPTLIPIPILMLLHFTWC